MISPSFSFLVIVYAATVVMAVIAFELGRRLGRWRSQRADPEPPLPVRVLAASILSLLAFILGFTFGLASDHSDSRSRAVFDEATAIGATYRRADLLPEPERSLVRHSLQAYVDLRITATQARNKEEMLLRLREAQERIWTQVSAISRSHAATPAAAPLVQLLTDLIEIHSERVLAGARSRIDAGVWFALYWIMALSLAAAGYLSGLAGAKRSIASVAYALVFAAVIVMIAAGDIPGTAQVRLNHQAMIDLRARMTAP